MTEDKSRIVVRYLKYVTALTFGLTIVIVVVVSTIHHLSGDKSEDTGSYVLREVAYTSAIAFSILSLCLLVSFKLESSISWSRGVIRKLLIIFAATSVLTNGVMATWVVALHAILHYSSFTNQLLKNLLIANVAHAVVFLLVESAFLLRQWRQTYVREQEAKRALIQQRYDNLRSLLKPHFLFNSLGVLVPLIEMNPKQAVAFVNHFSAVYRYVLDVHEESAVPLSGELSFLDSYIEMLKTLHGDSLRVSIRVDSASAQGYLPPLSLQLAVENAVKHNRISKDAPLHIEISSSNRFVVVANNLQRVRRLERSSPGLGQTNLKERYRMSDDVLPEFEETEAQYICRLPVIMEME